MWPLLGQYTSLAAGRFPSQLVHNQKFNSTLSVSRGYPPSSHPWRSSQRCMDVRLSCPWRRHTTRSGDPAEIIQLSIVFLVVLLLIPSESRPAFPVHLCRFPFQACCKGDLELLWKYPKTLSSWGGTGCMYFSSSLRYIFFCASSERCMAFLPGCHHSGCS